MISPNTRGVVTGAAGLVLLLLLVLFINTPSASLTRAYRSQDLLQDVFNETLGFQKIFVINLPSRTDHRDAMSLAAHLTGLHIEYVDGVTDVEERALPPNGKETNLNEGGLGNWRAHLNCIRKMVEQNITSALILEDDADWDIRIKSQMRDFAQASRLLVQPLPGSTDRFLDPTYPQPFAGEKPTNFYVDRHTTSEPTTSPYGDIDRWDMFWLGHCGSRFPRADDQNAPLGRAVLLNDETVPEQQHIDMQFGNTELETQYPAHTRVVSRARMNTCTLGYGLSLPGARRWLWELGLRKMTGTTDMMFRSMCDGVDDRSIRTCLTVQPQLFQHHRPVGPKSSFSDISDHGTAYNEQPFTRNVRWSTRVNFPKLVYGETDYIDLFRDGEPAKNLGF
ncbi:glycosyltransferase family 25 protein [Saccharata proteae CBS 121410]|uniref:Glycosyltransferase family 25 protein n=1 Tax=Saccharata proteae CBS 121410 TaxID=1314787 RepID=A0A9P4LZL6_9PEZI|nr:glycosyltransferase family 25 protein [Saccharata proteae CBS 121410]